LQEYMEEEDMGAVLRRFHGEMSEDDRLEFIVVLEKMLWFGPSNSMKRFVKLLLENGDGISPVIRCRMAEQVYEADDPLYIEKIRGWLPAMEIACRLEWIYKISEYPTYPAAQQLADWMRHIFHHPSLETDNEYRYRVLMDAGHAYEEKDSIFLEIVLCYRRDFQDAIMYKIMLAHHLLKRDLRRPFEDDAVLSDCLEELLGCLRDDHQPFEAQADVCDFFLNTEFPRILPAYREEAQRRMNRLFQEDLTSSLSITSNRQNVHSESIEKSSEEVLEQLHGRYGHVVHDYQKVQEWRLAIERWSVFKDLDKTEQDKILTAIHRIGFDKRIYGRTGDTLAGILALVWKHIHQSDHREELQKRLMEELLEASGQCSTGFAVRLLNTLSGFDDFMLKISYREAILTRVVHRLNTIIQTMEDEAVRDILLEEMTNPCYTGRKNFLDLFRRQVPRLKEELYDEFRGAVADTDFDLYLRQALLHYENA